VRHQSVGGSQAPGQWRRLGDWGLRLLGFGFIQALAQLCTALAGLLIVRLLTKQDYALFAIANSMQTVGNALASPGIDVGLRSIGGRVWNDPDRFGQLLQTALGLRRQFAAISLGVTIPLAAWTLWRNGASASLIVGLCLCVAIGVLPLLGSSVYGVSLQLNAQYRRLQQLDLGSALFRLALLAALAATRINVLLATAVGVVGNWGQFAFTRRWASQHARMAGRQNSDDRRELVRLSLKSAPNAVFFCFQGQVTLLILTLVGNPTGVADVTALGRIATLLGVFAAVFANVLAPRFARCQDPARLARLYGLLVGGAVAALAPLVVLSWLLPGPLLWLLGDKYAALKSEFVWVFAAGCLGQVGVVMWDLNSSKAWIHVQARGLIPAIVGVQLLAGSCLDLRRFHDVLVFGILTVSAPLPLYALDAWLGLRAARRRPTASP
jgi:O-antigen/teichoic acid export membrane protein